mmetsp:Transcript_14920/g.41256  ORF Transcript_14920/g.41256 Transcript_14920/m.41256 type:complete len:200 (+) Transcript_14920:1921-2520(+)
MKDPGIVGVGHAQRFGSALKFTCTIKAVFFRQPSHELHRFQCRRRSLHGNVREFIDRQHCRSIRCAQWNRTKHTTAGRFSHGYLLFIDGAVRFFQVRIRMCHLLRDISNGLERRFVAAFGIILGRAAIRSHVTRIVFRREKDGAHGTFFPVLCRDLYQTRVRGELSIVGMTDKNRAIGGGVFTRNENCACLSGANEEKC